LYNFQTKLPKVNNHPIGENSSTLVALIEAPSGRRTKAEFFFASTVCSAVFLSQSRPVASPCMSRNLWEKKEIAVAL
jgi:hypothetical protein